MIKRCPQKADSWRVVEITDSCLARSVTLTAVLSACQEPSAYRTCRLRVARPEIVQERNSNVREANRLSFCRSLLLGFIALRRKVSLLPISKVMAGSSSAFQINPRHCFLSLVRFSFIINMQERHKRFSYIFYLLICANIQ